MKVNVPSAAGVTFGLLALLVFLQQHNTAALQALGTLASPAAHAASLPAAGGSIRVAFSPGAGDATAEHLVVAAIAAAHHQLRIAAYEFTSAPIAKAVVEAKRRGVDVAAVMDRTQQTQRYSAATFLADAGIPVRIDYVPAILHDKFIVIDGSAVETGSYNYTKAATERNAENALLIPDPSLAATYTAEWQRLWAEAIPYQDRRQ